MENIKLLLLGGLDDFRERELFIKIIDHEPTLEDKKKFLKETISKYGNDKNLFPVKHLKLKNVKVIDCEDKVIPINKIHLRYFDGIKL